MSLFVMNNKITIDMVLHMFIGVAFTQHTSQYHDQINPSMNDDISNLYRKSIVIEINTILTVANDLECLNSCETKEHNCIDWYLSFSLKCMKESPDFLMRNDLNQRANICCNLLNILSKSRVSMRFSQFFELLFKYSLIPKAKVPFIYRFGYDSLTMFHYSIFSIDTFTQKQKPLYVLTWRVLFFLSEFIWSIKTSQSINWLWSISKS